MKTDFSLNKYGGAAKCSTNKKTAGKVYHGVRIYYFCGEQQNI